MAQGGLEEVCGGVLLPRAASMQFQILTTIYRCLSVLPFSLQSLAGLISA